MSLIIPTRQASAAFQALTPDTDADVVTGQAGGSTAFTTRASVDPLGAGGATVNAPTGVAIGTYSAGTGVFALVADRDNNRVLVYDLTLTIAGQTNNIPPAATNVFGQPTLFTNAPGTTQNTMRGPSGVAATPNGTAIFVADTGNHRVLRFSSYSAGPNAGANLVLGQTGYTNGTAVEMNSPQGVAVSKNNQVAVADTGNHRILIYNNPNTNGATPNVTLGGVPAGPGRNQLNTPTGVAFDADGRLYVADTGNNRVLRFDTLSTGAQASAIFGQPDYGISLPGTTSDTSLRGPTGVAIDSLGNLYVADKGNNRALLFLQNATDSDNKADKVFGQAGFTTSTANRGNADGSVGAIDGVADPNFDTLNEPTGIAVNPNTVPSALTDYRDLFIADTNNHRVLQYWTPTPNPTPSITQPAFVPTPGVATVADGANVVLRINGRDFASGATVSWDALLPAPLLVTRTLATRLDVLVPGAFYNAMTSSGLIPTAGLPVTVNNPTALRFPTPTLPSTPVDYPICFPKPVIGTSGQYGIDPVSAEAGSGGFSLTITGTNFITEPTYPMSLYFGGSPVVVDSVTGPPAGSTSTVYTLTAFIQSDLIADPGTKAISVTNYLPDPAGLCRTSSASTTRQFTLTAPAPVITSFLPPAGEAESPDPLDLLVVGLGFITSGPSQSQVEVDGVPFPSAIISSSTEILLPGLDLSAKPAGSVLSVRVINPPNTAGNGGETTADLPIDPSTNPRIIELRPRQVVAGDPAFLLTVIGANFGAAPKVTLNGTELTKVTSTPTEIVVVVPSTLIGEAALLPVVVDDLNDGLPASRPATLTVVNPRPVIDDLSPNQKTADGQAFTITVVGTKFVDGAQVYWDSTPLVTTYVEATELSALVPGSLVATTGTLPREAQITVRNPEPNLGDSLPQGFVVTGSSGTQSQTITFATLSNRSLSQSPFQVSATASSGLPVTFTASPTTVCTVTGNSVTLVTTGTCAITARQTGNAQYSPAPSVTRSFTITSGSSLTKRAWLPTVITR